MEFCERHHVNGICLFSEAGPQLHARVFTTSLSGGEDRGTGGAIASIIPYLEATSSVAPSRSEIAVRQGTGDDVGLLWIRANEDSVGLGGQVTPLAQGELVADIGPIGSKP